MSFHRSCDGVTVGQKEIEIRKPTKIRGTSSKRHEKEKKQEVIRS